MSTSFTKSISIYIVMFLLLIGSYLLYQILRPDNPAEPIQTVVKGKNLPLPRFAALNTAPVNARKGPGKRYPIHNILHWRNMPVKIIAEHDTWRKVVYVDGTLLGWIHLNLLTSRPYVQNRAPNTALKSGPKMNAPIMARVEEHAIGLQKKIKEGWIQVQFKETTGWLQETSLWGLPEKAQS